MDNRKLQKQINSIVLQARAAELKSFLLGIKDGPLVTFHFQEITGKDAMTIIVAGFRHLINMELEKHPEYSAEYRNIFKQMLDQFEKMIKDSNEKFLAFQSSGKAKEEKNAKKKKK